MSEKKEYTPSEKVTEAENAAAAQGAQKPGVYASPYEAQLRDAMERIVNREDFGYSLNGDALYRQYRDGAIRDGRRAMADTMGQASALTGGYGNSYAQAAGQQAYARQLEQLNDRIPELYALALDQYRQQSDWMLKRYDTLAGADSEQYARWQDALAAWQREADSLWNRYTDSRDFDYGIYRDDIADDQWRQEFDEDIRRYDQEWAAAHPFLPFVGINYGYSGGGSGSSSSKKTSDKTDKKDEKEEETSSVGSAAALGAASALGLLRR